MKKTLLAALAALLATAPAAHAGEESYITFGAGIFEVLDDTHDSTEFRLEYRASNFWKSLYPSIGLMYNTDDAVYGVFSLNYDVYLHENVVLTPYTGVGVYEESDSKNLGGPIEFRSGLEVAYQADNGARVGVNFSHMSNAGIYEKNPGQESLVLNVSVPTARILSGF